MNSTIVLASSTQIFSNYQYNAIQALHQLNWAQKVYRAIKLWIINLVKLNRPPIVCFRCGKPGHMFLGSVLKLFELYYYFLI